MSANTMTKTKTKRKPGRPRIEFNQVIADRICSLLAQGHTLARICRRKKMPSTDTVHRWRRENDSFATAYARARDDMGDTFADEVKDLAAQVTPQNANAKRVQIDATKWAAGANNKRYDDKPRTAVQVNVGTPTQADIDSRILEVGRSVLFLLDKGKEIERARGGRVLLPAPTEQASAELKGVSDGAAPSTPISTHDAKAKEAAPGPEDHAVGLSQSAEALAIVTGGSSSRISREAVMSRRPYTAPRKPWRR